MKLLLSGCFFILYSIVNAQSTTQRVKENAKWKTEQKVNQKVDKAIDDVLDGNIFKRKNKKRSAEEVPDSANGSVKNDQQSANGSTEPLPSGSNGNNQTAPVFAAYSKFDFVSGEKVLYYDDFERAEKGDFPTEWNTNAAAEIVTLNGKPDKWLSITKDGNFQPVMISDLPENFTLEFNVVNQYRASNILSYNFTIYNTTNARKDICNDYLPNAFTFSWGGCAGSAGYRIKENGEDMGENAALSAKGFVCKGDNFEIPAYIKISLWRQKSRLRIYVNEEKVVDLPQAFNPAVSYNAFRLGSGYMNYANGREHDDLFLVSNLKLAVGAPDTRNKLITEGRFSTTGILFNFQKATVKPESYGVIKEIATALKENPTVKISIIGHTSNDGDATANLALSKQRAIAVKQVLASEFGIDTSRMETDGKGGAEPVDNTGTSAGKANNRRVEFVKM